MAVEAYQGCLPRSWLRLKNYTSRVRLRYKWFVCLAGGWKALDASWRGAGGKSEMHPFLPFAPDVLDAKGNLLAYSRGASGGTASTRRWD